MSPESIAEANAGVSRHSAGMRMQTFKQIRVLILR